MDIADATLLDNFCRYWSDEKNCRDLDQPLDNRYDIISVCTSDNTHQVIIEKILESNSAVYIRVEKSLAETAAWA